jgi:hypothetical protein
MLSNQADNQLGNMPVCHVCGHKFKYRIKRSTIARLFGFWFPLKRYFCSVCLESRYVAVKKV